MANHPKAFISHASEDKDRFVLGFASKLRQKGVDAWLDQWEIMPGDSLIDKIFEEGIKNANVFIVILSKNSISNSWVREELDAGMVKKIEKKCRLIPVVLDDCSVPTSLQHLLWQKIADVNSYDAELSHIVNTIYGTTEKPAPGARPRYAETSIIDYLPELTKIDNLVFSVLRNIFLNEGKKFFEIDLVYEKMEELDLPKAKVNESLEILASHGFIDLQKVFNNRIYGIKMPTISVDIILKHELLDYEQILNTIVSKIVNEDYESNLQIHEQTKISLTLVNHFLEHLQINYLIELAKSGSSEIYVTSVSDDLKSRLHE